MINAGLFEDYVLFSEFQLRLYEISGNELFKQNGLETLALIKKKFYRDESFQTRAVDEDEAQAYENIPAPVFDQSHGSPLGTYLFLLRKWSMDSEAVKEVYDELAGMIENLKHMSLQNPLGFGSVLRALVYPEEAFKKVSVPLKWIKESKIQTLFPYFSSRFCLSYKDDTEESERWDICNFKECELSGNGFEEFLKVFRPASPDKKEADKKEAKKKEEKK